MWSNKSLRFIYTFLSPHGTDRSTLVRSNPIHLSRFHARYLTRCVNRIQEWYLRHSKHIAEAEMFSNDVSAYPRSFILRQICSKLDVPLICVFPEFLIMIHSSNHFRIREREKRGIRELRESLSSQIRNRKASAVIGRLANERRISNRTIANAAMLASRIGQLRFEPEHLD